MVDCYITTGMLAIPVNVPCLPYPLAIDFDIRSIPIQIIMHTNLKRKQNVI